MLFFAFPLLLPNWEYPVIFNTAQSCNITYQSGRAQISMCNPPKYAMSATISHQAAVRKSDCHRHEPEVDISYAASQANSRVPDRPVGVVGAQWHVFIISRSKPSYPSATLEAIAPARAQIDANTFWSICSCCETAKCHFGSLLYLHCFFFHSICPPRNLCMLLQLRIAL